MEISDLIKCMPGVGPSVLDFHRQIQRVEIFCVGRQCIAGLYHPLCSMNSWFLKTDFIIILWWHNYIALSLCMLIWKGSKMTILKLCSHFSIVIYIESFKESEQSLTWHPPPPPVPCHGKAKDFPYLFPHSQPQKKTPAGLGTHKCGCVSALGLPVLGVIVSTELPVSLKHSAAFSGFHSV